MGEAQDGVHGRPDFVAHVGQESALRQAGILRGLPRRLPLGLGVLDLLDIDAATEGALSKFRKHVPALALTLHVIDGNSGPVSLQSTVRALALADYFESHAKRAYASGVRPVVGAAKSIMKKVQAGALPAMFTARDVHQRGWSGLTDRDVVGEALDMLATHRHLVEIEEAPGAKGGRPKVIFTMNDRVPA